MSKDLEQQTFDIEIGAVLDRIALVSDSENDNQLAAALGVSRQVLFGWRKRATIPYDKIVEFARRHDVSLDYLLWGNGGLQSLNENKKGPVLLHNFGALVGLGFDRGGYAKILMGSPEIRRILLACVAYEARGEKNNQTVIRKLKELVDHYFSDDGIDIEILADVVIAAKAVRLEPEWPDPISEPNEEILEALHTTKTSGDASIHQEISGTNHQIAGRDVVNEAPKKKRGK